MSAPFENCLILIMGFAGSGKFTIAKEIAKYPNFKLVDNHYWINPILSLLEIDDILPQGDAGWQKVERVIDSIFDTIAENSPRTFSYVMTHEMVEGGNYSRHFYDKINDLINARNFTFVPVRLQCDLDELVKRVTNPARKALLKTTNKDRAIKLSHHSEVFYTDHPNEISLNNTDISAIQAASTIIDHLSKKIKK